MKQLKTMRNKTIDMGRLMAQNEHTIALGNARMNARGDILGAGGKIVRPRELIAMEYHNANPKAVKKVSMQQLAAQLASEILSSPVSTPAEMVKKTRLENVAKARKLSDTE